MGIVRAVQFVRGRAVSDDDLIEQVARAICIARGDDPDAIVIHPSHTLALTTSGMALAPPVLALSPAWKIAIPEARTAFVCIRDLRGILAAIAEGG
jgi:hypothetical protein